VEQVSFVSDGDVERLEDTSYENKQTIIIKAG
jgi:hypothetical protein